MNVLFLVSPSCKHLRRVDSVASLVNGCQRHYRLDVVQDSELDRTNTAVVPQDLAIRMEAKYRDRQIIVVTENEFADNWFSHEYRNSAVITVCDWEALYAPPSLRAYLMYQVAQSLIHFSAEM